MTLASIIKPKMFCYATEIETIPANSTIEPVINFNNDSDFLLEEIRQTKHFTEGGQQAFGSVLVQFRLQSGELFSNTALESQLFAEGFNGKKFFGINGRMPRIPANSDLVVVLTNTTGAEIDHQVQFWGYQIDKSE